MKIRQGDSGDYESAMILISEFAEESLSDYGVYLDADHLQRTFDMVFESSFALVDDEGKVVGILAGRVVNDICSDLPVYEETVWFVTKAYRRHGMKLLNHLEGWCREQSIHRITMCCMHNSQTDKLWSLYEKLGFRPQETRFIKELD